MLEPYKLKGVNASVPPITDDELQQLRRAKINTFQQLTDGTLIAPPGGGIATSGLSAQVVRDCDWYAQQMKKIENHVNSKFDEFAAAALADGVNLPEHCIFRLHVMDGKFVAVEETVTWGAVIFVPPQ